MRILLVGEYSRLHNTLKEGLIGLGHDVTLVGTPDGFKGFPVDYNYQSKVFSKSWLKPLVTLVNKLISINLIKIERGYRFKKLLPKLTNYDVVQLINESPINTSPIKEIKLLETLFRQNKNVFLLSCGTDYMSVKYAMDKKYAYSILTPLHENNDLKKQYQFILKYLSEAHQKLHHFIYKHSHGVIASDMDYHLPLEGHPKYLGLIPNPINTDNIEYIPPNLDEKITIFHGINRTNYTKKGNRFFEEAIQIIEKKHADKVHIKTTEDTPYKEYITLYNSAHIVLDQVYAYDQGYNALEAMAKGKVVFTGAEHEWLNHYNLEENTVAINAIPNAKQIAQKLEWLILNPEKIITISKNARTFIEKQHHYRLIAKRYIETWKKDV